VEVVGGSAQVLGERTARRAPPPGKPAHRQAPAPLGETPERGLRVLRLDRLEDEVDLVTAVEELRDDPVERAKLGVRLHGDQDPHERTTRATSSPVLKRTFCGIAVVKWTRSRPNPRSEATELRK
jgi:hypothetical protein